MSTTNTEDAMRWGKPHKSDLRDAIAQTIRERPYCCHQGRTVPAPPCYALCGCMATADAVMEHVEAYLQEHDAQTNERWRAIDAHNTKSRLEVERERIRQRIEALPEWNALRLEVDGAILDDVLADVLEAIDSA